jgi:hypothetical protein
MTHDCAAIVYLAGRRCQGGSGLLFHYSPWNVVAALPMAESAAEWVADLKC